MSNTSRVDHDGERSGESRWQQGPGQTHAWLPTNGLLTTSCKSLHFCSRNLHSTANVLGHVAPGGSLHILAQRHAEVWAIQPYKLSQHAVPGKHRQTHVTCHIIITYVSNRC
jgi:hypothetical protein